MESKTNLALDRPDWKDRPSQTFDFDEVSQLPLL